MLKSISTVKGFIMDNKKFLQILGFTPKNNTISVYEKNYKQHDYSIEIDFC